MPEECPVIEELPGTSLAGLPGGSASMGGIRFMWRGTDLCAWNEELQQWICFCSCYLDSSSGGSVVE